MSYMTDYKYDLITDNEYRFFMAQEDDYSDDADDEQEVDDDWTD